jgi:hypothetical protein
MRAGRHAVSASSNGSRRNGIGLRQRTPRPSTDQRHMRSTSAPTVHLGTRGPKFVHSPQRTRPLSAGKATDRAQARQRRCCLLRPRHPRSPTISVSSSRMLSWPSTAIKQVEGFTPPRLQFQRAAAAGAARLRKRTSASGRPERIGPTTRLSVATWPRTWSFWMILACPA